jgi:hypothetical protein
VATIDDIFRLQPIIQALGRLLFEHTNRELSGENAWASAVLDVRYDEQGKYASKIRASRASGEVVGLSESPEITAQLIELNNVRPGGTARWYGLKLDVTPVGKCNVGLNYDAACANDPDFLAS